MRKRPWYQRYAGLIFALWLTISETAVLAALVHNYVPDNINGWAWITATMLLGWINGYYLAQFVTRYFNPPRE